MKRILLLVSCLMLVATVAMAADSTMTSTGTNMSTMKKGATQFYVGAGYTRLLESGAPSGSIGAQAGVDYFMTPEISLGAMAGYYVLGKETFSTTDTTGASVSEDVTSSVIPIVAEVGYHIATTGSLKPAINAGAGVYINRAKADVGGVSTTNSESRIGVNVGASFKIAGKSSMGYGLDAKFHLLPKKTKDSVDEPSVKMLSVMAQLFFM